MQENRQKDPLLLGGFFLLLRGIGLLGLLLAPDEQSPGGAEVHAVDGLNHLGQRVERDCVTFWQIFHIFHLICIVAHI